MVNSVSALPVMVRYSRRGPCPKCLVPTAPIKFYIAITPAVVRYFLPMKHCNSTFILHRSGT